MKTKDLLKEWKHFLNETLILEITKKQVENELVPDKISQEDFDKFIFNKRKNKFIKPFIDNEYLQILFSSYSQSQNHRIQDFISLYPSAKEKLLDPIRRNEVLKWNDREISTLDNLTYDEIQGYLEFKAKSTFDSGEIRRQCAYQSGRPVVGSYRDFDVVYSETDYIVIEPKTTKGSVAWAHGKPDGSEETIDRVTWCTGVKNDNNLWEEYTTKLFHMFYVLNSNYENDVTPYKRICLSFIVENGNISLGGDESTVDADNGPLETDYLNKVKETKYYKAIINRIKDRKFTITGKKYYDASLEDFKIFYKEIIKQKNRRTEEMIIDKISNYTELSHDKERINKYLLSIDDVRIRALGFLHVDINDHSNEEFIENCILNKNLSSFETSQILNNKTITKNLIVVIILNLDNFDTEYHNSKFFFHLSNAIQKIDIGKENIKILYDWIKENNSNFKESNKIFRYFLKFFDEDLLLKLFTSSTDSMMNMSIIQTTDSDRIIRYALDSKNENYLNALLGNHKIRPDVVRSAYRCLKSLTKKLEWSIQNNALVKLCYNPVTPVDVFIDLVFLGGIDIASREKTTYENLFLKSLAFLNPSKEKKDDIANLINHNNSDVRKFAKRAITKLQNESNLLRSYIQLVLS